MRRYAFVGTGSRARMYLGALLDTHAAAGEPVAFCDTNEVRMAYHDRIVRKARPELSVPHYAAADFDTLLAREKPDVVVVTSPDATHARYVAAALRHGADAVVEKPMTTDAAGLGEIRDALAESGRQLTVTFNYRYSPRNALVRQLIAEGAIGEVTSVAFEWCLDTVHGADYFRRWHRDKANSGGLLVHKATHHFDLVNWWLADRPEVAFARGGLRFYGAGNARHRDPAGDRFGLELTTELRELYKDGEHLDGYIRDRDVFSAGITIEDNLNVVVGYRSGAAMSYTLHAHSPWEGYRVAVNGTGGRIELDVVERGRPRGSRLLLQRHWEAAQEVPIPVGRGEHGGGDGMLLDDVFHGPGDDPLRRAAGFADGAASVLVGIAGNESLRTGQAVRVEELGAR
ncbi:Gfo/Idh/MocA family protein [Phytohabitans houttuyneae]|uniref:Dehydrogenase n=1 Tax=Phytohabitans houttuyneae TaxID=1076126 RepID=A0A6V8KAX1_9ACTN|nr:Gfo/Idh/MocA family oxidoreductase [Phytohabitans houttuyneae]GFJ79601.1 dehydrogenase [Phytohabitans houttuyneae]